jgi:hypothetical protein
MSETARVVPRALLARFARSGTTGCPPPVIENAAQVYEYEELAAMAIVCIPIRSHKVSSRHAIVQTCSQLLSPRRVAFHLCGIAISLASSPPVDRHPSGIVQNVIHHRNHLRCRCDLPRSPRSLATPQQLDTGMDLSALRTRPDRCAGTAIVQYPRRCRTPLGEMRGHGTTWSALLQGSQRGG